MKTGDIYVHGISPFLIEEARQYDGQVKQSLKLARLPRIKRLMLNDKLVNLAEMGRTPEVLDIIIEDYITYQKPFTKTQVCAVYNSIMCTLNPSYKKQLKEDIIDQLSY